jgi:hypothetical protein
MMVERPFSTVPFTVCLSVCLSVLQHGGSRVNLGCRSNEFEDHAKTSLSPLPPHVDANIESGVKEYGS